MSSPAATVSGASISFMPESTASSDGGGMAARGANYFFGFLITFVVLLLIFVGCGIGSRRRFLARRREEGLFDGLDPWGQPKEQQKQPIFYEHPLGEPRIEDKWMYTTPLSMTLLRQPQQIQTVDQNQDLESNDSERNSTTSTHPRYPRHIAALITPFHERKQHMEEKPTVTEHGAPEALDIAVLIAMPSEEHPFSRHPTFGMSFAQDKNRASSENSNKPLPEVQIGVTTIPWHTEIASVP